MLPLSEPRDNPPTGDVQKINRTVIPCLEIITEERFVRDRKFARSLPDVVRLATFSRGYPLEIVLVSLVICGTPLSREIRNSINASGSRPVSLFLPEVARELICLGSSHSR